MIAEDQYIRFCFFCATYIFSVIAIGCGGSDDAHTVRGALAQAARAVETEDRAALYRVIDRRARAALVSIVKDRAESARTVRADYPPDLQPAALRSLGDAAGTTDAPGLFALRCDAGCVAELGANLGAPVSESVLGDELQVRTAAGRDVRMFKGRDGLWGLVWRTQELSEERLRAARERLQIEANAEIYRRRLQLEAPR
ncbi:MAG TPA: hypothetical protein VK509_04390 [Polyangiales bacterium]|nr:hypothetical protein [Polyangiales bacterium]